MSRRLTAILCTLAGALTGALGRGVFDPADITCEVAREIAASAECLAQCVSAAPPAGASPPVYAPATPISEPKGGAASSLPSAFGPKPQGEDTG